MIRPCVALEPLCPSQMSSAAAATAARVMLAVMETVLAPMEGLLVTSTAFAVVAVALMALGVVVMVAVAGAPAAPAVNGHSEAMEAMEAVRGGGGKQRR